MATPRNRERRLPGGGINPDRALTATEKIRDPEVPLTYQTSSRADPDRNRRKRPVIVDGVEIRVLVRSEDPQHIVDDTEAVRISGQSQPTDFTIGGQIDPGDRAAAAVRHPEFPTGYG